MWKKSGIFVGQKNVTITSIPPHPDFFRKNVQTGFREHLLCAKCENQIGHYEDYARKALFAPNCPIYEPNVPLAELGNLEYRPLKLFQMSILWRMAVTSDFYYMNVDLGKHEEKLRQSLLDEDPCEVWRYGTTLTTIINEQGKVDIGMMSPSAKEKYENQFRYVFAMTGMYWEIYVLTHPPMPKVKSDFLTPQGTWKMRQRFVWDIPAVQALREATRQQLLAQVRAGSPGQKGPMGPEA